MTEDQSSRKWPGQTDQAFPEVFTRIPPSALECAKNPKPGQFNEKQLKEYFEQGYVQVDDFFTREELEPSKEAIGRHVDGMIKRLHSAGKVKNLYSDAGLFQRLSLVEKEYPGSSIVVVKAGVLLQEFRTLWTNERLLNLMHQLLDTKDIQGHPVWNLRPKVPRNTATTVPWHQDSAYLDGDSYSVHQVTAWIPLLNSNEQNGCLEMITRGHQKGLVANHTCCWKDTWYTMLSEEEMEKTLGVDMERDRVLCPVPYGGALFFSNMIPHRSLPNVSNDIRWSLDLRWQRLDQPVGFHGLKEGVQFTSSTDPNFKIDWTPLVGKADKAQEGPDDLTTTIAGPWMRRWEMVHTNRHSEALDKEETKAATTGRTLLGWHQ